MLLEKQESAQQYWNERSELFRAYYRSPTLFDRVFRAGIYTRTAVALKVCKEFAGATVLDIGSGPGQNSLTFLRNSGVSRLVGIDFAPSMNQAAVELCKAEGLESRSSFILGDFLEHDWDGQQFDISVALGVFDYVEDVERFLARMNAVTTRAFVASWPQNGLRMLLRKYRYKCPVHHYNQSQIRELHEQNCDLARLEFVKSGGGWVTIARKK